MENTPTCTRCLETKDLTHYYLTKAGKLNRLQCKECLKALNKERYDKEQSYTQIKAWRLANPEAYKDQIDRAGAKRKERRATEPEFSEHLKKQKRDNSKKNFIAGMVGRARQRSVKYGVDFSITVEDVFVPVLCPILEIPLKVGSKGDYQSSPSIDRMDPTKGYVPGNIRVISTLANTMKNAATYEQLMTFCRTVPEYIAPLREAA